MTDAYTRLMQFLHLHDLVDAEVSVAGIRCDTEWCTAFHDWRAPCGDFRGAYAGLSHANRMVRAEARARGEPYEHGRLCFDPLYDEAEPE